MRSRANFAPPKALRQLAQITDFDIFVTHWLAQENALYADESLMKASDIPRIAPCFHGLNIKLMKSTGLREAHRMALFASALGLKVMLGCMTETSCAISAAAQMSPLVDWADLDGAVLIKNDLFDGASIVNGKVTLTQKPGIGVTRLASRISSAPATATSAGTRRPNSAHARSAPVATRSL